MTLANIGLTGLAVMGMNLVLNMERNGYTVAVHNRTTQTMRDYVAAHPGKKLVPSESLAQLVANVARPRKIMIMVKAGAPVDDVITQLVPLLDAGDVIIDGGNSFFPDTERRAQELEAKGLRFIGSGVSGGETGALWGPSLMPGGQPEAYELIREIFTAISAKVDGDPCVTYIGPRGAGHYVKMVHNGIEYGDMQLIAESYDILHRTLNLSASELHDIYAEWNKGELESYLIEITADIFTRMDPETGSPLVDLILDEAQQKGTGKWTSQNAFDLGVPIPTINAAVESRVISAYKGERVEASKVLSGPAIRYKGDRAKLTVAQQQFYRERGVFDGGSAEESFSPDELDRILAAVKAHPQISTSKLRPLVEMGKNRLLGALSDLERLFQCLSRAFEARDGSLILITCAVEFDPVREDARFRSLLERMGLGYLNPRA